MEQKQLKDTWVEVSSPNLNESFDMTTIILNLHPLLADQPNAIYN